MSAHLFAVEAESVATTTDDWYTPRWIFAAARVRFDMDVASPVDPDMRTCPADEFLTVVEDGLTTPWRGAVWCNPPYSSTSEWVAKWSRHPDGMLLVPAMREVRWLGDVLDSADALTLLAVDFHRPDGKLARIRWTLILAARGSCVDAVSRIAAADKYAQGGYLVARSRRPADTDTGRGQ